MLDFDFPASTQCCKECMMLIEGKSLCLHGSSEGRWTTLRRCQRTLIRDIVTGNRAADERLDP